MSTLRAIIAGLTLVFLFMSGSEAGEGAVPAYGDLHLESWSPRNNFRPIRNLQTGGKASFGFNEEFIWGYLQSRGVGCTDCASNSPAIPLDVAKSYLDVLNRHDVQIAREIVPERFVADPANDRWIEEVLKEYEKRKFTVVLALAWPVAHSPGKCFGFARPDREFDHFAYNYSAAIARLILSLAERGSLERSWLQTQLLVEPWNEFDSVCDGAAGSPERAARYQGIMQLVFDRSGLGNEVLMPSVVSVFRFNATTAVTGRFGRANAYLQAYYRAGGSGRPNVHLYPDVHWAKQPAEMSKILEDEIKRVNNMVPDAYRGSLLVGETAVHALSDVPQCNAHAMAGSARAELYGDLLDNPGINRGAGAVLFWRLFGLEGMTPNADNCDQFNGATSNAWRDVKSPPDALSTFNQTGIDLLNDFSRRH